jgi:hypothetical protein
MLIPINDTNNLDVTFEGTSGLVAWVHLSKDVSAEHLVGKKIFRIQSCMLRFYAENDTTGNVDLYTGVNTVDDFDTDHISTRIGDVSFFKSKFGTGDAYLNEGVYTKCIYVSKGVLQSDETTSPLIKIDLVTPANTVIKAGKI